jgi:alpha-L-rhamnosidase
MRYYELSIILIIVTLSLPAIAEDMRVGGLTCNYSVNPISMEGHPSLSWKLYSSTRGQRQTGYQVFVATRDDFQDRDVVWNSGKINSSKSTHIRYEGPALTRGTRYYWKVKVWDKDGDESISDVAFWETAPELSNSKALWISAPSVFDFQRLNSHRYGMIEGNTNDFLEALPLLRKQFSVTRKVAHARLYIAGVGFHEAYLNGQKVSDDILSPAFTNYDHRVLYNVHDITSLLRKGDNVIGIMLGNGWYNSAAKEVWGFDRAPWRNAPTAKCQLEITYDDNTKEIVVTDESWKAIPGPVVFSNLWQGEYYDARKEIPHWSEAGGKDNDWSFVRKVAGPMGALHPQTIPPVKVMNSLRAIKQTTLPNGNIVYDFGQNMAGFIHIEATGKSGTRLQFKYAEKINSAGEADQSNINNLLADSLFQTDRYTFKGEGVESWSPRFVYHGFRYVEVSFTGQKPDIHKIEAHAVHTSFSHESEFKCADTLINRIQQSTEWSFRNNFVGFPTDCPQREKNGWTGDAQLACETGLTNYNTVTSYRKWLNDLRDEQQPNGSLPGIVPTPGWGYYWGNGPAWDIACVVIPWTLYEYTGDIGILEENYDMMKRYVDYVKSRSPQFIADFGLGDWIPVETVTPAGLTSTGYFYYGASVVSKTAQLLDKTQEKDEYEQLSRRIADAFNAKYFDTKKITYANGSQTALSCALFHGLVPEKHKKAIRQKLVEAIHKRSDHIDCGILGARYLPHVLSEMDESELAYKLIASRTYPGWGYWIEKGATTLWEDWKGESSLNHVMLGDVSSWFYQNIAGIQRTPSSPGFTNFTIKLSLTTTVAWADGKYESIQGTIVSNWKRDGKILRHHIEVPVNTHADYHTPVASIKKVKEGGKTPDTSIKVLKSVDGKLVLRLEPGVYEFEFGE